MKTPLKIRIFTTFLALIMMIGLIPASMLTANAALPAEMTDMEQDSPANDASGLSNPVICTSYTAFKRAMEDPDIRYVALGNVEEVLPIIAGDGLISAINVKGIKTLKLLGQAIFWAPVEGKTYDSLLQISEGNELYIMDAGSLIFKAVATAASNAVIRNQGGSVTVYSGDLRGYYNTATYGIAIWQEYGNLIIRGGGFYCDDGKIQQQGDPATYPVYLMGGTTRIYDGTFCNDDAFHREHDCYGLSIGENADVIIYGGAFTGIQMADTARLSDYIGEGSVATCNGEKVNPANYASIPCTVNVNIYKEISQVSVYIESPKPGKSISNEVYFVPKGSELHTVQWYEDGQQVEGSVTFTEGKSYKVEIYLMAKNGTRFAAPLNSAMVNSLQAEVLAPGNKPQYAIGLAVDFGICPIILDTVELTVDVPKQHTTPDQFVSCGKAAYKQALVGDNMWDVPICWEESNDGSNWTQMKSTDSFSVGKHYRVSVNVMPQKGYEFALDPQIEPAVSASVNGYPAEVLRYTEANPSELICVRYNFGILNDSVIEQIDIDGIVEPVVGEKPSYGCAISGSGYTLNNAYSNGTYIINGIGWYDVTDDMWVLPNHIFQIGHKYKVFVDVKTENGYEFYTTGNSGKPAGWGYINDNYATFGIQSDAWFEQSLSWTFTCQPRTIKAVNISGLNLPVDGLTPDFDAIAGSEYYTVESIEWMDYTKGTDMTAADTFVGGNQYWLRITIVPKEENGNKLCKFIGGKTVATLNGVEVKKIPGDSWQDVESGVKHVRIYYTFENATSKEQILAIPYNRSATVIKTSGANIWSKPYSTGDSKLVRTEKYTAKVNVVGYTTNTSGGLWYKLSDGNWVYSTNIRVTDYNPADVESINKVFVVTSWGANIWSKPYSSGDSEVIKSEQKTAALNIVAQVRNSTGGLWYRLSGGGWVYSKNVNERIFDPADVIAYKRSATVIVPGVVNIWGQPSTKAPSTLTRTAAYQTKLNVVAKYTTPAGGLWYQLSDGNWVYSTNVRITDYNPEDVEVFEKTVVVTSWGANIWSKPYSSGDSKVVKTVAKSANVKVKAQVRNSTYGLWYQLADGSGWIYSKNVSVK